MKSITTDVALENGDCVLLGNWKPSGKSDLETSELTHLVFATANVQTLGGYGQKAAKE